MANYIRREIGAGQVKFIVIEPGGTLVVPAGAALLSVFVASRLLPWMPAILVLAGGGFLFYWLRNQIKRRKVEQGPSFVVSPTELVVREHTIPRASIEDVTWCDYSHQSPGVSSAVARFWGNQPDDRGDGNISRESSLSVGTVGGGSVPLAVGMNAWTAEQLAHDLGKTLGGVHVSGGRLRMPSSTTTG